MENLKDIPTYELVKELETREGVEVTKAEPYQDLVLNIEGPAIVISITD